MSITDKIMDVQVQFQRACNCSLEDLPLAFREGLRFQMHPVTFRQFIYEATPMDMCRVDFTGGDTKVGGYKLEQFPAIPEGEVRFGSLVVSPA